ncbi:hypothetical protein PR048_013497 [Dryococelus australis]|uniref:Uncharacterized protein n=1 Tax=Dryococelus australis TaxID=614101 RepID=A0ABQ9HSB8_9NEOP|nr:hypothetical protein PR048_013497 [Dryococelus australis]
MLNSGGRPRQKSNAVRPGGRRHRELQILLLSTASDTIGYSRYRVISADESPKSTPRATEFLIGLAKQRNKLTHRRQPKAGGNACPMTGSWQSVGIVFLRKATVSQVKAVHDKFAFQRHQRPSRNQKHAGLSPALTPQPPFRYENSVFAEPGDLAHRRCPPPASAHLLEMVVHVPHFPYVDATSFNRTRAERCRVFLEKLVHVEPSTPGRGIVVVSWRLRPQQSVFDSRRRRGSNPGEIWRTFPTTVESSSLADSRLGGPVFGSRSSHHGFDFPIVSPESTPGECWDRSFLVLASPSKLLRL